MARLEGPLDGADEQFVLLRITRMRGVNLSVFDFDYDLTWMGFFLDADLNVLGRYGDRDAGDADARVSLAGLRYTMNRALAAQSFARPAEDPRPPRFVEDLTAARRLPPNACVHCHQVYDLRRESLQLAKQWSLDELWVYPLPENVGLTLDVDRGDQIARVVPSSAAARAGLRVGDRLVRADGRGVASIADFQYALHRAGNATKLAVVWLRDGREQTATLELVEGWRKTDISWRWSLRGLDPAPPLRGYDLTTDEKAALALGPKRLAFRQGPFVAAAAAAAGVRQNDVVIGLDDKELAMTARQFGAYVRLQYKVGDRVTINLLRDGRRLDVALTLPGRAP